MKQLTRYEWGLRLLLAAFFLLAGSQKLLGAWHIVANFEAQGLSMTAMYFVGVLETVGAVGLLWRRLAVYAGAGLAGVELFTAVSSARVGLWDAAVVAVAVLGLTLALVYLLWREHQPSAV